MTSLKSSSLLCCFLRSIFFTATCLPLCFSLAMHTIPVEPSPILIKLSRYSRGSPAGRYRYGLILKQHCKEKKKKYSNVQCYLFTSTSSHLGWPQAVVQLWTVHGRLWKVECQSWNPRMEEGMPPGGCKVMKAVSRPPVFKVHTSTQARSLCCPCWTFITLNMPDGSSLNWLSWVSKLYLRGVRRTGLGGEMVVGWRFVMVKHRRIGQMHWRVARRLGVALRLLERRSRVGVATRDLGIGVT